MDFKNSWWRALLGMAGMLFLVAACSASFTQDTEEVAPTPTAVSPGSELDPTPTSTTTPEGASMITTPPTSVPSPCEGLSGEIEVQVLVGPAEVVGLEPFAVGNIPFSVITGEEPHILQGGGDISYADILAQEWGTYEVTLDLVAVISGECVVGADGEELDMILGMTGDQMVEVTAEGFHGEYPWAGEHEFEARFPLEEGAAITGEGWIFVLHLSGR